MAKTVPVVVHGGLPKTGTTTIQATLFKNRDRLAEAGVFMPVFASRMPGHRKLASLWREGEQENARTDPSELLEAVRTSVERARAAGGAVVLSSETLSDPDAATGAQVLLDAIRAAGGDLRVVAYARSPLHHLPSSVQQESRGYQVEYVPLSRRILMHTKRYENLKTLFGREAITLRIFDRSVLVGGDVVADFADTGRALGLQLPKLQAAEIENESIGASACALLLTLRDGLEGRLQEGRSAAFNNVRSALVRFEKEFGRGAKLELPQEWVPTLEDIVREPWNRLLNDAQIDETQRSRLRISESATPVTPARLDRSAWLLSYRDRAYEKRFVRFYKSQPRVKLPNLGRILGSL